VYRQPTDDAPLTERSPVAPRAVYGYTKLAAEALAVAAGAAGDVRVAVARSFNHTGPGQRPEFVVPALARRVLEARTTGVHQIRAGNVDVARDFSDVRDVVRAYRLLLESLDADRVRSARPVFNVASERAVTIRSIIETFARLADWPVMAITDPALVRPDDPPVIRGDASALRELTGWTPDYPLETTLTDLFTSLGGTEPAAAGRG
jgi:GDP-4-dehydro-6-deoxy-D-mannose reductase